MSQHCAGGSMRLCPPPDHVGCPQDWRGQSTPQGSGCTHVCREEGVSYPDPYIHHCRWITSLPLSGAKQHDVTYMNG